MFCNDKNQGFISLVALQIYNMQAQVFINVTEKGRILVFDHFQRLTTLLYERLGECDVNAYIGNMVFPRKFRSHAPGMQICQTIDHLLPVFQGYTVNKLMRNMCFRNKVKVKICSQIDQVQFFLSCKCLSINILINTM